MSDKLATNNANAFWTEAWATGSTGWRLGEVRKPFTRNIYLALKHLTGETPASLQAAEFPFQVSDDIHASGLYNGIDEVAAVESFLKGKAVLVPLCGDTEALSYMAAHGAAVVIGIDLSEEGLQRQMKNFPGVHFDAHEVTVEPKDSANGETRATLIIFEATLENGAKVLLFQGDLLAAKDCAEFTAHKVQFVYDRASLMAMNPSLRLPYAQTIASVMAPENCAMLIERPVRREGDLSGPPFAFAASDVVDMYEKATNQHVTCEVAVVDAWRVPSPDAPKTTTVQYFDWFVVTFAK